MIKEFIKKIIGRDTAPKRYAQLFSEIRALKPKSIMEVGTWTGSRAVEMIDEAKKSADAKDIHYYGFDLFEEMSKDIFTHEISKWPPSMATVKADLEKTGAVIHLYKGNTKVTMPEVVPTLPKIDFVFIDGGHSIETIQNDWENTALTMHEKTVVIFDDYWASKTDGGCKPIVDTLDPALYTVEIMPIVDRFDNPDFGKLAIQFAKVTKKAI